MDSKTKAASFLLGTYITLYVSAHAVADKDVPRNTKHITFLGQVMVNSSTSTIASGAVAPTGGVLTWAPMPNMMSSEDKSFSTSPAERQNKPADKA